MSRNWELKKFPHVHEVWKIHVVSKSYVKGFAGIKRWRFAKHKAMELIDELRAEWPRDKYDIHVEHTIIEYSKAVFNVPLMNVPPV